ncbi:hypothetical protein H6P81_020636 [Aristolochia fimbriata]|uniref:Uncharacterized protein n=1 Tax=Aristolochia fimbriata TaxID=158543 RepID=A0AAV7DY77_ARIFI|nr:hypothetical protein H6P81_020636 [Aristolochia fimbriata]
MAMRERGSIDGGRERDRGEGSDLTLLSSSDGGPYPPSAILVGCPGRNLIAVPAAFRRVRIVCDDTETPLLFRVQSSDFPLLTETNEEDGTDKKKRANRAGSVKSNETGKISNPGGSERLTKWSLRKFEFPRQGWNKKFSWLVHPRGKGGINDDFHNSIRVRRNTYFSPDITPENTQPLPNPNRQNIKIQLRIGEGSTGSAILFPYTAGHRTISGGNWDGSKIKQPWKILKGTEDRQGECPGEDKEKLKFGRLCTTGSPELSPATCSTYLLRKRSTALCTNFLDSGDCQGVMGIKRRDYNRLIKQVDIKVFVNITGTGMSLKLGTEFNESCSSAT